MNIVKQPGLYSPAYSPIIYQFGSTFSNALYFNINIIDESTNSTIIRDKAFISPLNTSGSEYNFSDVAKSLVKWEIKNTNALVESITDSIRKVYLTAADMGSNGSSMSELSSLTASSIYIWNGSFNRIKYSTYDWTKWVYKSATSSISFLTNKPNYYKVNDSSREFLYFLKDEAATPTITIKTLTHTGQILGTQSFSITSTASMVRLDVSPKVIALSYPSLLQLNQHYSIQIGTNSQVKYYHYGETPCNNEVVNILWENTLGGIDSYQFQNPVENRSVERENIRKNIWDYDGSNNYVDYQGNNYNQLERNININLDSTWKMWTAQLSDEENLWIAELLHSRNIFIELNNGMIYPVVLVETDYTINKQKYQRTDPLQTQWTFRISGDYITKSDLLANSNATTTTTTTSTTTTTTTQVPVTLVLKHQIVGTAGPNPYQHRIDYGYFTSASSSNREDIPAISVYSSTWSGFTDQTFTSSIAPFSLATPYTQSQIYSRSWHFSNDYYDNIKRERWLLLNGVTISNQMSIINYVVGGTTSEYSVVDSQVGRYEGSTINWAIVTIGGSTYSFVSGDVLELIYRDELVYNATWSTTTTTTTTSTTTTTTTLNVNCVGYRNETNQPWFGDVQLCDGTWLYATTVAPGSVICAVQGTPFTLAGGADLTEDVASRFCI